MVTGLPHLRGGHLAAHAIQAAIPPTSARNEELARWIAKEWESQGLEDVKLRRYDVLSSNPREVRVEMVAPERYVPTLREDPVAADPDTAQAEISGGWLSFSASGDVTAPAVYANSGNPADYDVLRKNGIDPRGKIVVVRYSNPYSYRGYKALTAEREGAAAMIVYSDPAEDGYARGAEYPKGPWGPPSHLQRGGIRLRLHRPRRSAHARLGVHARCTSHQQGRGPVGAHHHGRADVVARHQANSRGPHPVGGFPLSIVPLETRFGPYT